MNPVFVPGEATRVLTGNTIYVGDSHSFDYVPRDEFHLRQRLGAAGFASLVVASTLQLRLSISCLQVVYAFGYHPKNHWSLQDLHVPSAESRSLLLQDPVIELNQGEGYPVKETSAWMTWYSRDSSWICLGDVDVQPADDVIEFASGQRAVLRYGSLKALWLNAGFGTD